MNPFYENDSLINDAIDGKGSPRSAFTAKSIESLTEQVERQLEARARIRQEFGKADAAMQEAGMGGRERRRALRPYEADDDGADERDRNVKAWLQKAANMHGTLEDTLGAALTCIVTIGGGDDGLKSALAMFDSQYASDRRVHASSGRELLRSYPGWSPKSTLNRRWT